MSKFVQRALHNPVNRERRCWGKEKQLYSESPQVEKIVVWSPKEPSYRVRVQASFILKGEGVRLVVAGF